MPECRNAHVESIGFAARVESIGFAAHVESLVHAALPQPIGIRKQRFTNKTQLRSRAEFDSDVRCRQRLFRHWCRRPRL